MELSQILIIFQGELIEYCSYEELKKEKRLNIDELVKPILSGESIANESIENKRKSMKQRQSIISLLSYFINCFYLIYV